MAIFKNLSGCNRRCLAFTLAEVLITLGIIGVVASMTLPTVVQKYRNQVVETRLKKFYTVFNQAIRLAEVEYGDKKDWYIDASGVDLDEDGNPILSTSRIDQWFSKYLSSFIVIKRKSDTRGRLLYYLPDGSAFQLGTSVNASLRDIYFYPGNPDKCQGDDADTVGRCVWKFEYQPVASSDIGWKYGYNKGLESFFYTWDGSDSMLKSDRERGCYVNSELKSFCSRIIQMNNWKIPKDYPYNVYY